MSKRTRGTGTIIIIIIIVAIVAGIVWWKSGGKQTAKKEAEEMAPKIHLSSINITDIDDNSIKMISKTVMENPMPVDLNVDSLYYELWIDSTKVMESIYPKSVNVPKSDSATIELPVEMKVEKLNSVIKKFEQEERDSADYTLKADFRMKVPVPGKRNFDVNVTRRLPAIREIKVSPGKIDIEKIGLKESEAEMNIIVKNNNVFDIKLKDAKYNVTVDKDLDLEAQLDETVVIPAKSADTITMNMKFKTLKIPKLGWKMLFRDKKTRFIMDYSATLISDMEMMKNLKIKTHAEGTLDEVKDFVKSRKK